MPTKRKTTSEAAAPAPSNWDTSSAMHRDNPLANLLSLLMQNIGTVLLVVAAFLIGMLWTEVRDLKKTASTTAATTTTTTQAAAQPTQAAPTITKDQISAFLTGSDWIHFGDTSKSLVFVEVSDPSCPFCHLAGGQDLELNKASGAQFSTTAQGGSYIPPVPEMRKLVDSGKAAFVWLYYPGHGNGEMGTLALYCANEQGKFWEAHDLLMSQAGYQIMNGYDQNQQTVKGTVVKNDKTQSGAMADFLKSVADPAKLKACLDSGKYNDRLTSDAAMATKLGLTGTPLFFVNTTAFPGAYSWKDMQQAAQGTL
jgi:protein-disulfide isomerase